MEYHFCRIDPASRREIERGEGIRYPLAFARILGLGPFRIFIATPIALVRFLIAAIERCYHLRAQIPSLGRFQSQYLLHIAAPVLIIDAITANPNRVGRPDQRRKPREVTKVCLVPRGQVLLNPLRLGMAGQQLPLKADTDNQ